MKIKTIELNNYRTFYLTHTISIAGKNVLVYGENGSGKSSLYHALRCFFQAFHEAIPIEPQQNIFYPSLPSVTIEMDTEERFVYKESDIFVDDVLLSKGHSLAEVYQYNPFFTYKRLLRTYLTETDEKSPDLFSLLVETILPHHKNPETEEEFRYEWQELQEALYLRANSNDYRAAIDFTLPAFNNGVTAFLEDLTAETNEWLNRYFKHHVTLSFFPLKLNIINNRGKKSFSGDELKLNIEYFSKALPAPYYEFLNEARLSALALCLYLASLKTVAEPKNKFLFLDDIFIGLDTSNRLPLLNILQHEFSDYQIFLTTYDKYWFELARDWFTRKAKDQWTFLEMYVDDRLGFEVPRVIPTQGYRKKAGDYLASHDYPACGMYLRKECERILSNLLKPVYRRKHVPLDDKTKNYSTEQKNLNEHILGLKEFCVAEQLNYADFEDLAIFKNVLLNPLSHHDIEMPIYKSELQAIIDILEKLDQILVKGIPKTGGEDLTMRLKKSSGEYYSVRLRTREHVLLIKEPSSPARLMHCCQCERLSAEQNGSILKERKPYDSLQEMYADACKAFGVPESQDLLKIIFRRGTSLEEMMVEQSLF